MAVYSCMAYGIELTEEFGDKLSHIPQELYEYAVGTEDEQDEGFDEPETIVSSPTAEGNWAVFGVGVGGISWDPDHDHLKDVHDAYLANLAKAPKHIQDMIKALDRKPYLCVLAGRW